MNAVKHMALLLLILLMAPASAEDIQVAYAHASRVADAWYLDARIDFAFHDDVTAALNAGVDLSIDIQILIKEQRTWLWDKVIKESLIKFKLVHQPLANLYIVTHVSNHQRVQFDDLQLALRYLGTINHHRLLNAAMIDPAKDYISHISVRLNMEDLPPALKPVAYLSNRWRLNSQDYIWHFQSP